MNIRDIKGLKYPDEYFIKFFFKKGLHLDDKANTFIELGCANGCNLSLAYQFGNHVIGVDYDKASIENAHDNFSSLIQENNFSFYCDDMREFVKNNQLSVDVLSLANSIYYIPKNDFVNLLRNIKGWLSSDTSLFIRFRGLDDFRYGKGKLVDENSFIIENGVTGEDGAYCCFYSEEDMLALLMDELNLRNYDVMNARYDNIQNGVTVSNHDIIIWGSVG